ncbi:hypothetical protein D3C76_1318460 [compost metagenome]
MFIVGRCSSQTTPVPNLSASGSVATPHKILYIHTYQTSPMPSLWRPFHPGKFGCITSTPAIVRYHFITQYCEIAVGVDAESCRISAREKRGKYDSHGTGKTGTAGRPNGCGVPEPGTGLRQSHGPRLGNYFPSGSPVGPGPGVRRSLGRGLVARPDSRRHYSPGTALPPPAVPYRAAARGRRRTCGNHRPCGCEF